MVQALLHLDEKENKIVEEYKKRWGSSKCDTIRRIIREFDNK